MVPPARSLHLDELPSIPLDPTRWRPIRRTFGITGFSANGYTAPRAGEELIEPHDERSAGAGGHEELYVVVAGHATFTVGDEEVDAPVGTLVFVPPGTHRSAVAAADDTTVVVVGGKPGAALPVSPFEHWYAAEEPFLAGDYDAAIRIASAGFEDWPDHPHIHFQLACYHARAGELDQSAEHLRASVLRDPKMLAWAERDDDLAPLRTRPDWPA